MSELSTFSFDQKGVEKIRAHKYGSNWPVVYLIENGRELYVGETIRAYSRTKQHLDNKKRQHLKKIHIVTDNEFNKSATLDTESSLIEYLVADGQFKLQNGNAGLQNHDYFDREKYQAKFDVLWEKLQKSGLAKNNLLQIRNSDLFKYSPYKTLTGDQYLIASKLLKYFKEDKDQTYVIHGGPGTGKTILATYLIKQLVEGGNKNIALVIAMTSLRKTLKNVFRSIPGLSSAMVIGPGDVIKKEYDILIVDEAHRLRQRRNIPNFGMFDKTNKQLGLGNDGDELDWVVKSAKQVVLFFDEKQSVRPSDISTHRIQTTKPIEFNLASQMRVKGGEDYLKFVDEFLEFKKFKKTDFENYDFKVYGDLGQMVTDIKKKDKEHTLARLVAGYAWKWVSRTERSNPDIVIGDTKLFWNSQTSDWVNSSNAVNEVGCIHTIQGYDLNYAGVIIGPELSYDPVKKEVVVDRSKYMDTNGYRGVVDPEELKRYVINIYKTLMTRGILGTYVYIADANLREYYQYLATDGEMVVDEQNNDEEELVESPYFEDVVKLPLYDSVGCGELIYADPVVHDTFDVPQILVHPGAKYFVLRTTGDSMNELGINDGDYILCQKNYQASSGSIAVVLVGEDATLKEIKYESDGLLLIPHSNNKIHKTKKLGEDDEFKVLGVFVKKLAVDND